MVANVESYCICVGPESTNDELDYQRNKILDKVREFKSHLEAEII